MLRMLHHKQHKPCWCKCLPALLGNEYFGSLNVHVIITVLIITVDMEFVFLRNA